MGRNYPCLSFLLCSTLGALVGFPISCGQSVCQPWPHPTALPTEGIPQPTSDFIGGFWVSTLVIRSSGIRGVPAAAFHCTLAHQRACAPARLCQAITHNGSCMCFIKQPCLILMKTLADEVYWRLQGLCGLFSWFVLHSCASPRTRAVPVPALPGGVGRQSCDYVLCKGSCPPLELTACWGSLPTWKQDGEVLPFLLKVCHNNL